ncbi:MAG: T9SS type A sorting domain-containing protein [Candidatus Cloacimonetes bacterium]|nr:T9SS type A sorting domain-containing protein [Candidatus Cloacimonadota bacterium]
MKAQQLLFYSLLMFFLLSCSLFANEKTVEWYEEQGLIPETFREVTQIQGTRSLREIPEGGLILIPDSTPKRVMAFDPQTGDLIDANFIPPYPDYLSTPIHIVMNAEETGFLMTDQLRDLVLKFSLDGLYEGIFAPIGGVDNTILDNIRGMFVRDDGHYLVTVAAGGNAHAIAEFDSNGQYLGNFINNGAGGLNGPWDIIYRPDFNDYLISTSGSNAIHRYDENGVSLGMFVPSINFPEQMQLLPNGNVLVATFSAPSGVYEFNSQGVQVGFYGPVTALRGVYELPNGNILVTNGTGVYEINRQGALVDTKIAGVSARFITFVGHGVGHSIPFEEDFETGSLPEDWLQEYIEGTNDWTFQNGGHLGYPSDAYEGDYNALFYSATVGHSTTLITPPLLIGNAINPVLRFQHAQAVWGTSQDELSVYYRIGDVGDWVLLESYNMNVPQWTERMISLPEADDLFYIGFEAISGGGYGVCIDMVEVFDHVYPIMEVTPLAINVILVEGESTTESLTISNVGTADLEYEITFQEPAAWLTVTAPTGTVLPNESVNVDLEIDTIDLTGGENYSATLIVTDNYFGMEINVTISLYVEELILNPPLNLSAEIGMFFIELSWDEPISNNRNLLGYNLYRQDSPEGNFEQINTVIIAQEYYLDDELQPSIYSYYVTAVYTQGESDPSDVLEVLLPEQVALPTIEPEPGVYNETIYLELFCDTEEANIHYTFLDEVPDEDSSLYEVPIYLDQSATITARAFKDGLFPSPLLIAEYTIVVSADDVTNLAPVTNLYAAYPNPFNPNTTITFSLAEPSQVKIEIFNIHGQKVKALINETRNSGLHTLHWDGSNEEGKSVRSGIYFYRMTVNDFVSTRKMMLIQ